jgi:Sensors of blue-light using FAD
MSLRADLLWRTDGDLKVEQTPMRRLIYISTRSSAFGDKAVEQACEKFAVYNETASISGILLFSELNFLQVIEGPGDAIGSLFERIKLDPRHSEIVKTDDEADAERCFGAWSMRATQAFLGRPDALDFIPQDVPVALSAQLRNFVSL